VDSDGAMDARMGVVKSGLSLSPAFSLDVTMRWEVETIIELPGEGEETFWLGGWSKPVRSLTHLPPPSLHRNHTNLKTSLSSSLPSISRTQQWLFVTLPKLVGGESNGIGNLKEGLTDSE
jgi:hypothetical protein